MALQYGVNLRNAKQNAITTQLGATSTLKLFSGAEAANCAAADPSGLLATLTLPNPMFGSSSSGTLPLTGTWSNNASGSGTAASFRIYDSSAVCQIQGSCSAGGGGGDMILSSTTITSGLAFTVTAFNLTAGNV